MLTYLFSLFFHDLSCVAALLFMKNLQQFSPPIEDFIARKISYKLNVPIIFACQGQGYDVYNIWLHSNDTAAEL